jgi:hypothetical protein
LISQGELSDVENLYRVHEELFNLGHSKTSPPKVRLQEQLSAMQKVRDLGQQQDQPYWQTVAQDLIAEGVISVDVLKAEPSAKKPSEGSDRPKPLGPRKPLSSDPTPSQNQHTWEWLIWTLSGLVSLGLLRWVLKKFNKA